MKTKLFRWLFAAFATAGASSLVSCVYDPYSGGGYGGGYGGYDTYGGYGYGPTVHTSLIFTSDSRWGYDRYRHCYYDYHRRAYYDPFLYGYYPIGYLPPIIYGAPHPYGWYPGRGACPPPRHIRSSYLSNYHNRVELLRQRDYSWARSAREDRASVPDRSRDGRSGDFNRIRDTRDPRSQNIQPFRDNRGTNIERLRQDRIENVERVGNIREANLERFRQRQGETHDRVIATREANLQRFQGDRVQNYNRVSGNRGMNPNVSRRTEATPYVRQRQEAPAERRVQTKESKEEKENGRGYGR